jgi:hypothetical protein
MRKLTLAALIAVALAGCGKANIVAVKRPVLPIYICSMSGERASGHCEHRFDAGQLIGMKVPAAERLAKAHGYILRPIAPLPPGAALFDDAQSNRIDIEVSSFPSASAIVVRLVSRG